MRNTSPFLVWLNCDKSPGNIVPLMNMFRRRQLPGRRTESMTHLESPCFSAQFQDGRPGCPTVIIQLPQELRRRLFHRVYLRVGLGIAVLYRSPSHGSHALLRTTYITFRHSFVGYAANNFESASTVMCPRTVRIYDMSKVATVFAVEVTNVFWAQNVRSFSRTDSRVR